MTIVAVASLHGSPGASTLALGLAGSFTGSLLVEADGAGGTLAARCGLPREPGLITLAADRDARTTEQLLIHAQRLANGVSVLPCSENGEHTTLLLRSTGGDLAVRLAAIDLLCIVDAGRLSTDAPSAAFAENAVATVLVVRPNVEELTLLAGTLPTLHRRPVVVLVGDRPYGPNEVMAELDVEVVGVVAHDVRGAAALWGAGTARALARSAFARSVRQLADILEHGWLADNRPELVERSA